MSAPNQTSPSDRSAAGPSAVVSERTVGETTDIPSSVGQPGEADHPLRGSASVSPAIEPVGPVLVLRDWSGQVVRMVARRAFVVDGHGCIIGQTLIVYPR